MLRPGLGSGPRRQQDRIVTAPRRDAVIVAMAAVVAAAMSCPLLEGRPSWWRLVVDMPRGRFTRAALRAEWLRGLAAALVEFEKTIRE